jgi:hexosaminidase
MKHSRIISLLVLLLCTGGCNKGVNGHLQDTVTTHGIIPLPLQADFSKGYFRADSTIAISGDENFSRAISVIAYAFQGALKGTLQMSTDTAGKPGVRLETDPSLTIEGYTISVSGNKIRIRAKTAAGAFYAAQTLRQMIWSSTAGVSASSFILRNIEVKDAPKYAWRGFHIDLSRHLFTKEYIESVIDQLAYYKINKLHLHLSDDQGWRIEISQYPLLTSVGGWRTFNSYDSTCLARSSADSRYEIDSRFISTTDGKTVYGGSFTKQDIAEIVNYAAASFIEVVPEIDMPGHMTAAIMAYPYLSCTGSQGWGSEFSYPVCPCSASVMDFCHGVYDEIATMFPSEYVHLGSDEVNLDTWKNSDACQSFMTANNMKTAKDIQSWFVADMQHYLEAKGKKVVVWDDVIDGTAGSDLVMMYWRDWVTDSPARCAANGNSIILAPWSPFYISSEHTDKSLQDLYDYDPEKVLPVGVTGKVIGLQTCLWTEEIPSESMFEYLVYPRMQALSEVAWGAGRDWVTFRIRLESHLKFMQSKNIRFRKPGWAQ